MDASVFAAASAILVAIATGLFAWLQGRHKGRADFQTAVNTSFNLLVNQLQEELTTAKEERNQMRQDHQITQSELRYDVGNLRVEVMKLQAHIIDLERLLAHHKIGFSPYDQGLQ